MWCQIVAVSILVFVFTAQPAAAVWSCSADTDCSAMSGSVCLSGDCVCPAGQQPVQGGTLCVDLAPYHTSSCVESHQCERMSVAFECRTDDEAGDEGGTCSCQPGHHFFLGRCWRTSDFNQPCTRSEECLGVIRDPYSLTCNGVCDCAPGYYQRQRGECRRIGYAVGDGCVLDEDCQFEGGACNVNATPFTCYNVNEEDDSATKQSIQSTATNVTIKIAALNKMAARQHGDSCGVNECPEPFECSSFGVCLCPIGYYPSEDGSMCYAELGSPSSEEQCKGLLAVVQDGVCTCPSNFFFADNMRDCIRATRRITESCVSDTNCYTFGTAAVCGPAQEPWGLRTCACDAELAVWDDSRQICRLFAGIGDPCEVDSDCLAGELEIQCRAEGEGQGYCACPDGYVAVDGLCLTTGLALGDACQASQECTETENTVCEDGRCSCDASGYREVDGACAPIIGGVCAEDLDCVIEHTVCSNVTGPLTCQCGEEFVRYEDSCWPTVSELGSSCNVSAQCQHLLGEHSACAAGRCACDAGHHHRDGRCWPVTGLFESCTRSSQCYLPGDQAQRVVCRNSLCQCEFHYPYDERLLTCTSSSTKKLTTSLLLLAFAYILT